MNKEIIAKLEAEFDEKRVKTRAVGDRQVSYLEAYDVIDKANEVFGYGAWGTAIIDLELHETGGKTACVVTLELSVEGCFARQDVGVCVAASGRGQELSPEALETAIKGAASDALKRAMRHFGKQFGNSLYDKERANSQGVKQEKPQPKKAAAPKGERKSAGSADQLKGWLEAKASKSKLKGEISDAQVGFLAGLLSEIFGPDEMGEHDRHAFLDYIFGTLSSKELNKAQASALIEWAKDGDGVSPVAKAEAVLVLNHVQKDAGQQEMEIDY